MVSLKQYAESSKVTYEAVRKQVARYKEELGEHLIQDGRQFFLDDYAVAFLDEKRRKNPVVLQTENKDERIAELEKAYEDLQKKFMLREAELQGEIAAAEKEAKEAYKKLSESSNLIASAEANQKLLETKISENEGQKEVIKNLRILVDTLEEHEKTAQEELKAEKTRKLTLKERIFGVKINE